MSLNIFFLIARRPSTLERTIVPLINNMRIFSQLFIRLSTELQLFSVLELLYFVISGNCFCFSSVKTFDNEILGKIWQNGFPVVLHLLLLLLWGLFPLHRGYSAWPVMWQRLLPRHFLCTVVTDVSPTVTHRCKKEHFPNLFLSAVPSGGKI